jgi:hypothetical protein
MSLIFCFADVRDRPPTPHTVVLQRRCTESSRYNPDISDISSSEDERLFPQQDAAVSSSSSAPSPIFWESELDTPSDTSNPEREASSEEEASSDEDPIQQVRMRVMLKRARLPDCPESPEPSSSSASPPKQNRQILFESKVGEEAVQKGAAFGEPQYVAPGCAQGGRCHPGKKAQGLPIIYHPEKLHLKLPGTTPIAVGQETLPKFHQVEAIIGSGSNSSLSTDTDEVEEDYMDMREMEEERLEGEVRNMLDRKEKLRERQKMRRIARRRRSRFFVTWPCETCGHRHKKEKACPLMERIEHCALSSSIPQEWCQECKGYWFQGKAWLCNQPECFRCKMEAKKVRQAQLHLGPNLKICEGLGTSDKPYVV